MPGVVKNCVGLFCLSSQLTQDGASTFGYDGTGNRTNTGYATGGGNRITTDGVWVYTHDRSKSVV